MSDVDKRSKKISKQPRAKRSKKDPAAPKRPRSAYILFCQAHRPSMKNDYPDSKPAEIMTKLGEKWKEMSDEEKAPYSDQAKNDKSRFDNEMADYEPPADYSEKKKSKKTKGGKKGKKGKRSKKDPNEPKRGLSAYIYFGQEKRDEVKKSNPSAKSPEIMKILGQMWRELSEDEKTPYKAQAEADKARYEQAKANYDKTKTDDADDDDEEEEEEEEEEQPDDDDDDEEEEEDDEDDD